MTANLFNFRFYPIVAMMVAIAMVGCTGNRSRCVNTAVNQSVEPIELSQDLAVIDNDLRSSWNFTILDQPVKGIPFMSDLPFNHQFTASDQGPAKLRPLSASECLRLASLHAPVAVRLEKHCDWLSTFARTPRPVLSAFTEQAAYERSKHVMQSMETYFGLMRVYSTASQLERSIMLIEETEDIVQKIRIAALVVPYDYRQLDRERIQISEKSAEGRYRQGRLQDGLELLLNINSSDNPIWTAYEYNLDEREPIPGIDQAVAIAWVNRGDLRALEILAENAHLLSLEVLQTVPGQQDLISSGLDLPGPAKWWQCILKQEIECLKQKSKAERKRQLHELAKNKRQQIRLEVATSIAELSKLHELYDLKLSRLRILKGSLEEATKIKDQQTIEVKSHLQTRAEVIELRLEIIDLRFQIETEHHRLHHFMGDSGG